MAFQAEPANCFETMNYCIEETLRNGRKVIVRAIRADDKAILQELMRNLSPESRYFRFFTAKDTLTERDLVNFIEIDFTQHVGLLASVVELGSPAPAGTERYVVCPETASIAELSFAVEEQFQGMGIATLLLKHLTDIARKMKIDKFVAYVLSDNRKMLDVFAHFEEFPW